MSNVRTPPVKSRWQRQSATITPLGQQECIESDQRTQIRKRAEETRAHRARLLERPPNEDVEQHGARASLLQRLRDHIEGKFVVKRIPDNVSIELPYFEGGN